MMQVKIYSESENAMVTSVIKKAHKLGRGDKFRMDGEELEVKETRKSDNGTALCIYAYDADDKVVRKDVDLEADMEWVGKSQVRQATNIVARTH